MPSKMAGMVAPLDNIAEVQEELRVAVYDALNELASQWDEGEDDDDGRRVA